MKEYTIIRLSDYRDMIIMLTMDLSLDTLRSIESDLAGKAKSKSIVYFDFLISNGMSNRFFYSSLSNFKNRGALKACNDIPKKYVDLSNSFFEGHLSFLDASVLSTKQKAHFIEKGHLNK